MRGRAECARIMFKLAGVEFEDVRVVFPDEWPEFKKSELSFSSFFFSQDQRIGL